MTVYSVRHVTHYTYKRPVSFGQHRVLFRPRDSFDQRLLEATMTIEPRPAQVRWIHDVFGNCIALVDIDHRSDQLRFETNIRLDHNHGPPIHLEMDTEALTYPFSYDEEEMPDLACTIARSYEDPEGQVEHWAQQFVGSASTGRTAHVLMTLCFAIRQSFVYARRTERGTQTPIQTLQRRQGTCRDFALLMMEAARSLGFAARFVTGYIYVHDRDGSKTLGGGSTHAWCQIYLPGAGWVEFDPTNGIVGNQYLIRVGVARDPRQAIPLWGTYEGDADDFDDMVVQVNVTSET
ncbi:transglutaminase family protein [Rhizobiaceae bacterium n13]|uniref:Transglutaminase family protein n=1 Tax=Ferirhizobium litorale TaxID=2927786 RepID=A0AAE3Q828_9HYPH|nr:transglutaminase family protein [Fererhizobium litorale]MDI7860764.1 transglutaminase family protein [Fererhizobium litorale]MDI7920912.1 transglutaminase family protein [Fererhizobium litorale]